MDSKFEKSPKKSKKVPSEQPNTDQAMKRAGIQPTSRSIKRSPKKSKQLLPGQKFITDSFRKDETVPLARGLQKIHLNKDEKFLESAFQSMELTPTKRQTKISDMPCFKKKLSF